MGSAFESRYDVVILGAGLAGLSLARQLLLETKKTVLLVERREQVPPSRQKVGEATVQVSGYYFSKVLDLEEHLLREHYMKYNLRFLWKNAHRDNRGYEDYSQSYIRPLSNVASYQLDRNKLETELLRRNLQEPGFRFAAGVKSLGVALSEDGPHEVSFHASGGDVAVTAEWVVDATGRNQYLARRLGLRRESPIRHASYFFWVDGLLDLEKLTDRSPREIRLSRDRAAIGHLPFWLATNHLAGEGYWVWIIPLRGKTSVGVVFDREVLATDEVSSPEKLRDWLCREFPLLARELPRRQLSDFAGFKDFAYDCSRTIDRSKWALSGESSRFSDPLYSPGGDLIALHNTLIAAAIQTDDEAELSARVGAYDQLMRAVYDAYVPGYTESYEALGDQEAYSLKYTWELTVYFALYVFPFLNDLFTDRRFILGYLRTFSKLGPVNHGLQVFLKHYVRWKKAALAPLAEPRFYDFMELGPLQKAEQTFYQVGVTVDEAKRILNAQFDNLEELARFIAAHVASVVLDDPRVLTHRAFVAGIDLQRLRFDPQAMRARYEECAGDDAVYPWSFDPFVLERFHSRPAEEGRPLRPAEEILAGSGSMSSR